MQRSSTPVQYAIHDGPRGGSIRHFVSTLALSIVPASSQAVAPAPRSISIEDEVLVNVRAQPIGPATVADLALPEPFLRRVADRIVRSSYEDRFRIVISDEHAQAVSAPDATAAPLQGETDSAPEARQVLLWTCVAGFLAVFAGLVVKGRRRRNA